MHAIIHIITDHPIESKLVTVGKNTFFSMPELEDIMAPYNEGDFYDRYYNPETDEMDYIPREEYPEFLWDYYTHRWTKSIEEINNLDRNYRGNDFDWKLYGIWAKKLPEEMDATDILDQCYVLIRKDGTAVIKERWNGQGYINQLPGFIDACMKETAGLKPTDYITEVDYHW